MHFSFPRFATILRHPFSCSLQKWSLITKWLLCVFFLEFTPHTESSKIVTITVKISHLGWKSLRVERNSIICGECRRIFFNKKKTLITATKWKTHIQWSPTHLFGCAHTHKHTEDRSREQNRGEKWRPEKRLQQEMNEKSGCHNRGLCSRIFLCVFFKKIKSGLRKFKSENTLLLSRPASLNLHTHTKSIRENFVFPQNFRSRFFTLKIIA